MVLAKNAAKRRFGRFKTKPSKVFRRKVMKVIRPERKFIDTTVSHIAGATATINSLVSCAAGDTNITRDGRKIVLKSIQWRLAARTDTDNIFGDFIRVIIFQDKRQVADTIPTAAQLLQDSTSTDSMLNRDTGGRFKVLKDFSFAMTGVAPSGQGQAIQAGGITYKKGLKKLNIPVYYNGDAGTDVEKNGVYCLMLANENDSGEQTTVTCRFRIRFTDM